MHSVSKTCNLIAQQGAVSAMQQKKDSFKIKNSLLGKNNLSVSYKYRLHKSQIGMINPWVNGLNRCIGFF
jgi:hypothetical protein